MSQPKKQPWRKLPSRDIRAADVDKLLNALRALDRTVVEISMNVYRIPRHHRAALLEQHRRLHDTFREHVPRLFSLPQRST